jgi:hypothetical protein
VRRKERVRKDSRRIKAKRKIRREKEHHFVRRFPSFARSSF